MEQNTQIIMPGSDDESAPETPDETTNNNQTLGGDDGSGCRWGLAGLGGCLAVLIVPFLLAGLLIFGTGATIQGIIDSVLDIFRVEPRQAVVETTSTIVTRVQSAARLTTTEAGFTRSNVRVSIRDGFQNTCGFSVSHRVDGTIEAGVDLSQITEDDITYDTLTETYTLTLPPVQLTGCRVDDIEQYNASFTICNADWDEARRIGQYEALIGFRDDALESDLLLRAQDDTQTAMVNFLAPLIDSGQLEIVIREREPNDAPVVHASCNPDPPLGWTYDPETGAWID